MILFIYGTDTFRSGQFLRESIADFKKKRDPNGYNTVVLDALTEKPERILSEILTPPFLAEKRLVALQNILSVKGKDFLAEILAIIDGDKIKESNVVIFWQADKVGTTTEAKKLLARLKQEKFIYEFNILDPADLSRWIIKESVARGGKIGPAAANYLTRHTGNDMWLVNSLINQLVAYKNGGDILSEDIKLFLPEKVDDNIFLAVEMIVQGNKKQAFRLINEQRRLGQGESYLFSMVLRQFKILLQLRNLWDTSDNMTSDSMAKILGLHPFVVKKSLGLVRRFSFADLKKYYADLLSMDIATKTGSADPAISLDCFIGKGD